MKKVYPYLIMFVFGAGAIWALQSHFPWNAVPQTSISSSVVLERIEAVSKLVTAEGHYANVYHYDDHYWMDVWPFRKQATVRVKLKALVGLDLKRMKITPDEATKTFRIDSIPDVEPIAIDPEVEYFDLQNGLFNSFGKEDLNRIQRAVRELSLDAIRNGDDRPQNDIDSLFRTQYATEMNGFFLPLIQKAREEGVRHLELIESLADAAGWKVQYGSSNRLVPESSAHDNISQPLKG